MMRTIYAVLLVGLLTSAAVAEEVRFTTPPTAAVERGRARIAFAVSAPTDVEVAIVDAQGRVLRHLAAGVLGPNAPAPLTRDALAQEVSWDLRDDGGSLVAAADCRVRVRLGATAKLGGYFGWGGEARAGQICGLAVGKGGELFVLQANSTYGRSDLRVLDRDGKYLRTLLPYPADAPESRLASFGRLTVDGAKIPVVQDAHAHGIVPLTAGMNRQSMFVHPAGYLVLASAVGTIANHGPPRHLLAMHPDGGSPDGISFVGPQIVPPRGFLGGAGESSAAAYDGLAASPDGRWIYVATNIESGSFKPYRRHGVFRLTWADESAGEPFLGKAEAGEDDAHFNDPQGVAVDAAGNLYVADRGNNRVMVFSADGKLLGRFAVDKPQVIAVHPATGAIYVVGRPPGQSHKIPGCTLSKFSAFRDGKAELKIQLELKGRAIDVLAVDPAASGPMLWAAVTTGWQRQILTRITEAGGEFVFGEEALRGEGLNYPLFAHADAPRGCLYVSQFHDGVFRLDLATDKLARVLSMNQSNEAVPAADGSLYVTRGWTLNLLHMDREGKPLTFSDAVQQLGPWTVGEATADAEQLLARSKGPHVGDRGHAVGPGGELYIILMSQYGPGRVDVYAPDGTLKKQGLIDNLPHGTSGIAVDRDGSIYLGVNLRPAEGPALPAGFDGQVPEQGWRYWRGPKRPAPWCYPYFNTCLYHYGGVIKFPPAGGRFYMWGGTGGRATPKPDVPADAVEYRNGYLTHRIAVAGAAWYVPGCGPVPTMGQNWGDPSCTCNNSRLAVDGFGRVFVPDCFRFCVTVLDAAGNRIARIGRYGNPDPPAAPAGQIAFAWPAFVTVGGETVYVSDSANRRVAAVQLDSAADATCPIGR